MTTTAHTDTNKNYAKAAERATDRVDGVIKSVVDTVRDQSAHYMDEARNLAQAGKESMLETAKEVEDSVKTQSDVVLRLIKENPIKSLAIAVGVGYALSCMSKK